MSQSQRRFLRSATQSGCRIPRNTSGPLPAANRHPVTHCELRWRYRYASETLPLRESPIVPCCKECPSGPASRPRSIYARGRQITRTGLLFFLTALLIALGAFASANNLLFLLLSMVATLMISGLVSRLSLSGAGTRVSPCPNTSPQGNRPGASSSGNLKSWMPSFSIHLTAQGVAADCARRSISR